MVANLEAQLNLQNICQEITMSMHLGSIPARIRSHDSGNSLRNAVWIRRHMDPF